MNSEAIATLTGVALGVVSTLAAARITRKGSEAQADATYRAAVTTAETGYQAAVTTAKAQYASALEALNRTAQREAYVSLISTANAQWTSAQAAYNHIRSVNQNEDIDLSALEASLDTLQAAHGAVELEGPPSVLGAANAVLERARKLTDFLSRFREIPRAEDILLHHRCMVNSDYHQSAVHAQEALEALRCFVVDTPEEERHLLNVWEARADIAAARETRASLWLPLWDSTHETLRETTIPDLDSALLPWHALENPFGFYSRFRDLAEEMKLASVEFVNVARARLNDTQPNL
ncbi:hypothetical protein [Streptomyces hawaiiensis]|jgi:hypothetical protein|uniref:hypothetical protein n=1 Tax=Streptomyces hawaiiensis TaxID=67305 RepID=UPI003650D339